MLDELTKAQMIQDSAFIDEAMEKFIIPLHDEILELNPEYDTYSNMDMFAYLMRLDYEYLINGEPIPIDDTLMLDFGSNSWAFVHAGMQLGEWRHIKEKKGGEAVYYLPRFVSDLSHNRHPIFPEHDRGNVAEFLKNESDTYSKLNIPYKVALLSLYVYQNTVKSMRSATSMVASGGKVSSPGFRFNAEYWLDGDSRYKGWIVRTRDLKPSKDLSIEIARELREQVEAIDGCYGENELTNRPKKYVRSNQERTDTLVNFVRDVLPKRGKTPGKNGYTWEMARNDFWDEHPEYEGYYPTGTAFANSYKQAVNRRKGC